MRTKIAFVKYNFSWEIKRLKKQTNNIKRNSKVEFSLCQNTVCSHKCLKTLSLFFYIKKGLYKCIKEL